MTSEDDLFDQAITNALETVKKQPEQNFEGRVVIRTFMQKTVFRIYPNGNVSIDPSQSSSWFTDKEMWKKKEKAKPKAIKQATIQSEENY